MPGESDKAHLEEIVKIFNLHQVEYLVIGGQAEYLFGSPRATFDVDLCYHRTAENLQRLVDALRPLRPTLRNAPPDLPFQLDARALALGSNFTFHTLAGNLDLLGYVEPLGDYEQLSRNAEEWKVGEITVRVIALDDLITIKRHVLRTKDQESLRQLLALKRLREMENGQT